MNSCQHRARNRRRISISKQFLVHSGQLTECAFLVAFSRSGKGPLERSLVVKFCRTVVALDAMESSGSFVTACQCCANDEKLNDFHVRSDQTGQLFDVETINDAFIQHSILQLSKPNMNCPRVLRRRYMYGYHQLLSCPDRHMVMASDILQGLISYGKPCLCDFLMRYTFTVRRGTLNRNARKIMSTSIAIVQSTTVKSPRSTF